jgi:hypothetical protein
LHNASKIRRTYNLVVLGEVACEARRNRNSSLYILSNIRDLQFFLFPIDLELEERDVVLVLFPLFIPGISLILPLAGLAPGLLVVIGILNLPAFRLPDRR